MTSGATAAVLAEPMKCELLRLPLPDDLQGGALARVEACAICGTDVALLQGSDPQATYPLMPGHEPVVVIERIDRDAATRWAVGVGARVVVSSSLACGVCRGCREGSRCLMAGTRLPNFGYRGPEEWPGLWGGFATHMYLPPYAVVRPIPTDLAVAAASLFNAVGNAWHWAVEVGEISAGERVLVVGPGPRGLACAAIAHLAGAREVVVVGLPRDRRRLQIAGSVGATAVVGAEESELVDAIRDEVGLMQFDLVIDASSGGSVADLALGRLSAGGRLVLGGIRHGSGFGLSPAGLDRIVLSELKVLGARSTPVSALDAAVRLLGSDAIPWEAIATDSFPLERLADAVKTFASGAPTRPVHARIEPRADSS